MTKTRTFLTLSDDNADITQLVGLPFTAEEISDRLSAVRKPTHPLYQALIKDRESGRVSCSNETLEVVSNMVDEYLPEGTDFQKGYLFGTFLKVVEKLAERIDRRAIIKAMISDL